MSDLSNETHASARGGHRANTGSFRIFVGRDDVNLMLAVAPMRRLMKETGSTAEQVVESGRRGGQLSVSDEAVPMLIDLLKTP